jgi:hypothetical protein
MPLYIGRGAISMRLLNKQGGKLLKKLQVAAPSRELNDIALPRLAPLRRKQAL